MKQRGAKKLLSVAFDNDLIPSYLQSEFSALRALLESGTPTVRNRSGGHGQGPAVVDVPDYIAAYALHLTGASILLLVGAAK